MVHILDGKKMKILMAAKLIDSYYYSSTDGNTIILISIVISMVFTKKHYT